MIATRSIVASPFPGDSDAIHFAGFDPNFTPVRNTGWIVRSSVAAAIGDARRPKASRKFWVRLRMTDRPLNLRDRRIGI
jgi:hypothetical protein